MWPESPLLCFAEKDAEYNGLIKKICLTVNGESGEIDFSNFLRIWSNEQTLYANGESDITESVTVDDDSDLPKSALREVNESFTCLVEHH